MWPQLSRAQDLPEGGFVRTEGTGDGRDVDLARSLMKRALDILDRAGDLRCVPHLQHALDVLDGDTIREPTHDEIERILGMPKEASEI